MFNGLRLSIVVTTEALAEILAEIKAIDADRKNSYVISAQSLIESIRTLLLR